MVVDVVDVRVLIMISLMDWGPGECVSVDRNKAKYDTASQRHTTCTLCVTV